MQVLIVPPRRRTIEPMVTRPEAEKLAFAKRLNEACDMAGIPPKGKGRQQTIAKMFGVTQKGARKWLEGEAIPETKRIPEISRALRVAGEWLLTGTGSSPATGIREEAARYSPDTLRLAEAIQSLSPSARATLKTVVDAFAQSSADEGGLERRRGGKA
jgi:transcriptional regulator with XRE-family HTH domain